MINVKIEYILAFLCCSFFIADIVMIYSLCIIYRMNRQRYQYVDISADTNPSQTSPITINV